MPVRAGNGGGGSSVTDHFGPRYIVGNVAAGDPAVAQVAPFRYIPDPNDGTGIQLALTEAAASGGWVHIRRGTYNFQLGAVTGPLTVPANVRVTMDGPGLTTIQGRSTGNQGVFIMSAGSSLEDGTITAPAAGEPGTARGLVSVVGDGVLLRRLALAAAPSAVATLRSLISLVAGAGGTTRTTTIEDVTYAISGAGVSTVDPTSALEVVPAFGACIAQVENFSGTGGDVAILDASAVGQGINQLTANRLTLATWVFGAIRWNGVGVIETLSAESAGPNAAAICVAIACRPQVPSTVLRDVWLDPKGTVSIGVKLLADVNGNVGQAPEIDGVTWSGNAGVSALVSVVAAVARGGVISRVHATNNISANAVLLAASNPDWIIEDCSIEMLGAGGRIAMNSDSVRTKFRDNSISLLASGAGGAGTAIRLRAAQPIVEGNTIVTANAADIGIDGTNSNTNGNIVGNILDMNTDANAFVSMAVTCNVANNVVV